MDASETTGRGKRIALRIIAAFAVAGLWALLSYWLVEWALPDSGVVSVSFAIIQPAAICAFIAYVGDPFARRPHSFYRLVPVMSTVGMIAISIIVIQEGAICIAMLSPLWMLFGWVGTEILWHVRGRGQVEDNPADTFLAPGLLALPLVIMPLESALPIPQDNYTVSRTIVIDAPAKEIWPLMGGMGMVADDEGLWNISQNVIGLPRPREARLEGTGIGAIRHARWQLGVNFREVVDQWQPGKAVGWRFDFAGSTGWEMTDRHLRPDGPYLHINNGGYDLRTLADGRQLLRLHTNYRATTHFNAYAALWGELFLGDVQNNVLSVIKQRAEAQEATR